MISSIKIISLVKISNIFLLKSAKFLLILAIYFLLSPWQNSLANNHQFYEHNYFASLRSDEVNIRSGPGANYQIKFTYKRKAVPVRVISEYDNWLEIEDFEKQTGWLNKTLVTKKRTAMIITKNRAVNFYHKPDEKSKIIFRLAPQVIGKFLECNANWCRLKISDKKGWIRKIEIYGA